MILLRLRTIDLRLARCDTHITVSGLGHSQGLYGAPTSKLEVTLDTLLESVDLAENIVQRVAEAAGFSEEDVHKFGMAVREGVINAYNYGNRQDRTQEDSVWPSSSNPTG